MDELADELGEFGGDGRAGTETQDPLGPGVGE